MTVSAIHFNIGSLNIQWLFMIVTELHPVMFNVNGEGSDELGTLVLGRSKDDENDVPEVMHDEMAR